MGPGFVTGGVHKLGQGVAEIGKVLGHAQLRAREGDTAAGHEDDIVKQVGDGRARLVDRHNDGASPAREVVQCLNEVESGARVESSCWLFNKRVNKVQLFVFSLGNLVEQE